MNTKLCPYCGDEAADLLKVDSALKQRLVEGGEVLDAPDEVCAHCYRKLTSGISQGAQLRAKQMAKEQQRMIMWRNRVNLIKSGRAKMQAKSLSDAALAYEKYIRVLEIVYDKPAGELSPSLFQNKGREKELPIITSVYWDLMKIYDSNARYTERQQRTAKKVVEFAKACNMTLKLAKQADSFSKTAKNQKLFLDIVREAHSARSKCFVATAAFLNSEAPEVLTLTHFRDHWLMERALGRAFVMAYYELSPPIADSISKYPALLGPTRFLLRVLTRCLKALRLAK